MEIKKEIVEVVEQKVKELYNLQKFVTTEFSIKTSGITVKVVEEDTIVSVRVAIDKALEYYYWHLVGAEEIDETEVSVYEFVALAKGGIPVERMPEVILARSE